MRVDGDDLLQRNGQRRPRDPGLERVGGNMPKSGTCITSAQLTEIQTWLACGAPDD